MQGKVVAKIHMTPPSSIPLGVRMLRLLGSALVPLVAALILSSCTNDREPLAPPSFSDKPAVDSEIAFDLEQAAAVERAAALAGRTVRGIEDAFLRIESQLPGFGGLFIDSVGRVVVYGPPAVADADIRAIVRTNALDLNLPEAYAPQLEVDGIRVLPAHYPFSHLLAWQQALASLGSLEDGIIAYDADEGQNRVGIGVANDDAAVTLFQRADSLGIPRSAITTYVTGVARGEGFVADSFITDSLRPIRAGAEIRVSGGQTCTMGFVVNGASWGAPIPGRFLTAAHCVTGDPSLGETGAGVFQDNASVTSVATIVANSAFNIWHPSCGGYLRCAWADVAVAEGPFVLPWAAYGWPRTRWITSGTRITGVGSITGEAASIVGIYIERVGITSGSTGGYVAATCVSQPFALVSESYMNLCASKVTGGSSGPGDSGGPVVTGAQAVGSHVGVYCPPSSFCSTFFNTLSTARTMNSIGNPF